ncbi:MAG: hypothetical protein DMG26_16940, partial [Acidobacteria bacterium]
VAATFVDLETNNAVRVVARDDSRLKAKAMFQGDSAGELSGHYKQQLEAYKVMGEAELFTVQRARVKLQPETTGASRWSAGACCAVTAPVKATTSQ